MGSPPVERLTGQQLEFVRLYIARGCTNAAQCYQDAYPNSKAKRTTLSADATMLLRVPAVARVVAAHKAEKTRRLAEVAREQLVTKETMGRLLARIALADIRNYVEWDGAGLRLIPSGELTEAQAAAIESVEQRPDGTIKFKLGSKAQAARAFAELAGWLSGTPDKAAPVDEAKRREARQILLDELAALAKPAPLVIDQDGGDAS